MPNTLRIPFFRQKTDAGCLPACIQMVLAYLGLTRSQAELSHTLGTHPLVGPPYSRIIRLQSSSVKVIYQTGDLVNVAHWLAQELPVIAFVQLRELPYWHGHWAQHALVLVGLNETSVQVLDPARDERAILIPQLDFLLAWDEVDDVYAVITRRA